MWFLGRIKESLENIPQELGRNVGKSEEDVSAKASLSNKLHSNILTPDNIPEFCLPPRLTRGPLLASQGTGTPPRSPSLSLTVPQTPQATQRENVTRRRGMETQKVKKTLPFSAEGYGLAGMYESPNTRRKESLFHSNCPVFTLERTLPLPVPTARVALERNSPGTSIRPGLTISFKSLSETGSTESDTPSSNDSSPIDSPPLTRSRSSPALTILMQGIEDGHPLLQPSYSSGGPLMGGLSSFFLTPRQGRKRRGDSPLPNSPTPHLATSPNLLNHQVSSLAPPLLFPLDVLHCQERLQLEHVLLLTGRGRVRLSTERAASSVDSTLFTVRVRVISVESLRDKGDLRPLNCCLSLSLIPGKLQQQQSATIRNCRSPVFNEDFFFTELSQESLVRLELRLKVLDKAGHSTLKKGVVLGVITEPLTQLLPV